MKVAVLAVAIALAGTGQADARVHVFQTTHDLKQHLRPLHAKHFGHRPAAGEDIVVQPGEERQPLTAGFGVSITDTSAKLLHDDLSQRLRDRAMHQLWSRGGNGIGLTFLRIPIGGSDYVVGKPYSYDDEPGLEHFSTAHDDAYVFPMLRHALALRPDMTVMANPWTPPAWMKTDNQLITTTGAAGHLKRSLYGTYAQYLVKSLQAYEAAGIKVDILGVQNEPLTPLLLVAGIPESYLSPQDEGDLIHSYVAPALVAAHLSPRIAAFDDGFYRSEAYLPVVQQIARADVDTFAYHCYLADSSSIATEHAAYPSVEQLETECSSKLSNVDPQQMAIRSLRDGAQGIQLWNAALDQHGGPKVGNGCKGITPPFQGQDCIAPITVHTDTHRYSRTADFWALAHFSRFLDAGARRIASTAPADCATTPTSGYSCGLEDVAFRNPDGSKVLVATANDGKAHAFTITVRGRRVRAQIPAGATQTYVWDAPRPALSGLSLSDGMLHFTVSKPGWLLVGSKRHAVEAGTHTIPAAGARVRVQAIDVVGARSRVRYVVT